MLRPLAGHERPPVQRQAALARLPHHHDLAEGGHHGPGGGAGQACLYGHIPPSRDPEALLPGYGVETGARLVRFGAAGGQKGDPGGVMPRFRQGGTKAGTQETVGYLHEQAGTVACGRVGPLGAPVLQLAQAGQAHLDHGMAGAAVEVGDEGDPARVMLELGPVQPRLTQVRLVQARPGTKIIGHLRLRLSVVFQLVGCRSGHHWPTWHVYLPQLYLGPAGARLL